MKRIRIFEKEYYIFDEKEHEDALSAFCGIDAGLANKINTEWVEKHIMKEGHVIDQKDYRALYSLVSGQEFARKHLTPLKRAIGWSTQKIWES